MLAEDGLRDKVKQISGWPTVPQFFVQGQFIGGNDILREMHYEGTLANLFAGEQRDH